MNTPRTLIIFWIQLNRWYNPDGPSVILHCHAGHQYSLTKNCRHSHNTFLYYSGNKLSLNHIKHIRVILWQAQKTCTPTNVVLSWITFVLTMSKIRCSMVHYSVHEILFCSAPVNNPCTGSWSQLLCSIVTNSTFHQVKKNSINLLLKSLLRLLFTLIPVFNQTFRLNPITVLFQTLSMPHVMWWNTHLNFGVKVVWCFFWLISWQLSNFWTKQKNIMNTIRTFWVHNYNFLTCQDYVLG